MRRFVCVAAALFAVPAIAQDTPPPESEAEIIIESEDDGPVRFHVERDGPRILFRGPDGERTFDFSDIETFSDVEIDTFRGLGESPFSVFRDRGPAHFFEVLGSGSVSAETRERMRALQAEAREIAQRARLADGEARLDAVRQLDGVLDELFDVRGQARQEEVDALRERAREWMSEADEKEAALRDRAARRDALIEARRAELLGETSSDW